MCYLPRHHGTTWQTCTTPVAAAYMSLRVHNTWKKRTITMITSGISAQTWKRGVRPRILVLSLIYNFLHTLDSVADGPYFGRHLDCIPIKNLRILKRNKLEDIETLMTTDPPVQLKELWISYCFDGDYYSLLWNYLARVTRTSLTHLIYPFKTSNCQTVAPTRFPLSGITISPHPCRFCSSFCR